MAAVGPVLVSVFTVALGPALAPIGLPEPVLAVLLADPAALIDLDPSPLAGDQATAVAAAARGALISAFRVALAALAVAALLSAAIAAVAFRRRDQISQPPVSRG